MDLTLLLKVIARLDQARKEYSEALAASVTERDTIQNIRARITLAAEEYDHSLNEFIKFNTIKRP
ncbi:MAG: hypothetical protein JWO19_4309 [Bryobacterales bacterium]|nr:hypothetical protein [Bryobacterales bacterium]